MVVICRYLMLDDQRRAGEFKLRRNLRVEAE
jgi:hypothetical protein